MEHCNNQLDALDFVIVVFPDHTHLLFLYDIFGKCDQESAHNRTQYYQGLSIQG